MFLAVRIHISGQKMRMGYKKIKIDMSQSAEILHKDKNFTGTVQSA